VECAISRSLLLTVVALPAESRIHVGWRPFIVVGRSIEKDWLHRRLFTLRLSFLLFSTLNLEGPL
jgi:hypothetical protein